MTHPRVVDLACALHRAVLRLHPDPFREQFGDEIDAAFEELARATHAEQGMAGLFGVTCLGLLDIARVSLRLRRRAREAGRRIRGIGSTYGRGGWDMGSWPRNLRIAVRSLRRRPSFTLIAVVTLSVGIGSNAAVFGVVRTVLLEPLPYGNPDGVVTIWSQWSGFPKSWVSLAEYRAYVTQSRTLEDLAIWNETDVTFTNPENPERVAAASTSENLTSVLQVEMAAGRYFTRDEAMRADTLPAEAVVISYEVWSRRWSRDPAIVGSTAEINGRQREIIGVLPEGFRLPTQFALTAPAEVFFPLYVPRTMVTDYPEGGGSHGWHLAGRLRGGVTVETARRDIREVVDRIHAEFGAYPPERGFQPLLYGASDDIFGTLRPALTALFASVVFVLLIACANVANLLLARNEDGAAELAVRAALGAGRGQLVGHLLLESLVLATAGGVLGVALATVGIEAFKALNPGNLPRIDEVRVDGLVLTFSGLVTLGTALVFGTLPALRGTGGGLRNRMGGRGEKGSRRPGWQGTLVAVETAAAVVLVVGAGLTARTFGALTSIEPGFETERRLTLAVSLPTTRYPDAASATAFWQETIRRVGELPGVTSATAIRSLPLGSQIGDWGLDFEGYDESVNPRASGDWQIAAPGYFETMGIPLVAGRDITWGDDASSSPVAVVNERLVEQYLPGVEPLGQTFVMSGTSVTIVGVARNVTHNGLTAEIKPKFYIPLAQWNAVTRGRPTSLRIVVGTAAAPEALIAPVRRVVRDIDPSLAIAEIRTVDDLVLSAVAQPRFVMVVMGAFSLVALVLALVGVYGVISYGVGRKTREIGLRMALGASNDQVVGLMLKKGLTMVGTGLVVGLALALALSRYLESLLYQVSSTDPTTFAAVMAGFAAVALLATWLPARQAARIDPLLALKTD